MNVLMCAVLLVASCHGQNQMQPAQNISGINKELSERIGKFAVELLFHTSKTSELGQNFIMSPITVWTALAVIDEGATGNTKKQLSKALRLPSGSRTRQAFKNIERWLQINTPTVELSKINAIFVNQNYLPEKYFQEIAKDYYQTVLVSSNFNMNMTIVDSLNEVIFNKTRGKIDKLVDPSYFRDAPMVVTSALYFKGQWSVSFKASLTEKAPFYDTNGKQIGEVNMMYKSYTYPYSYIRALQATVIELPYGKENRLSMLIMLPNPGVSLEDMMLNFKKVTLDWFFDKLRVSKEEYSDEEVDCFIPRFKIKSDLDLTNLLKERMGIVDLFDSSKAQLPLIARTPMYVWKVVHKAEIEVTEEGTEAAGATAAVLRSRSGPVSFEANRPFTYMIVEKVTNSIVFGGFYKTPSLY